MCKNGIYWFVLVIVIFSLSLVVVQFYNLKKLQVALNQAQRDRAELEGYISDSFNRTWRDEENMVLDLVFSILPDSCVGAYLPASLCRACFSSLVFSLQENNVEFSKLIVLSEANDYEVRSECLSRGIAFRVMNSSIDGIDDIIIARYYRSFLPLSMKYNIERDYELSLFLSDDNLYLERSKN